jgi:3-phenylpropionate/trans-cinnamate dioxygenase ferredoxin reductase component
MATSETEAIVIIGASHAGVTLAAELRAAGSARSITIVGEESGLPYHRPHLSKDALSEGSAPGALRPAAFYADKAITLHHGKVASIDREARLLHLTSGDYLGYHTLVLATGARARELPAAIPGGETVLLLRDRNDWQRLSTRLDAVERIVVIGAGLIGLEVAAAVRARGIQTVVCENAGRIMARSLYPTLAEQVCARHRAAGIDIRLSTSVKAITPAGVQLGSGADIPADLVLAAVGSQARDTLACDAGLDCDDGIVVDARGASRDPAIYALGDCARWDGTGAGLRHESIAATQWQAKCVAAAIVGQLPPAPSALRLWSNQGAMRIQMSGEVLEGAQVVEQEPETGGTLYYAFSDGKLVGVQAIDAARPFASAVARLGAPESAFEDLHCPVRAQ